MLFKDASCISEREAILWSEKNELNEKKKQYNGTNCKEDKQSLLWRWVTAKLKNDDNLRRHFISLSLKI